MASSADANDSTEDLPEVSLKPVVNNSTLAKQFDVDGIVWARWKTEWWPALVRVVNKHKKKVSVVYVDSPLNSQGKECRFNIDFKKVVKFDSSKASLELKEQGLKGSENLQAKIELAIEYMDKRNAGNLSVSPIEFFVNPISDSLAKQRASKKKSPPSKTTPKRPTAKRKFVEEPSPVLPPVNEPVLGAPAPTNDVNIVPLSHTDLELYEKLVKIIKSEECEQHLLKIRKGETQSVRHNLHNCSTPSKRAKLKFLCFTRIMDDKQMEALVVHFRKVMGKHFKSMSETSIIDYVMDVWVPEALSFGLQSALSISSKKANAILRGDDLPDANNDDA